MTGTQISVAKMQTASLEALSAIRDDVVGLFQGQRPHERCKIVTLRALFRYKSDRAQATMFLLSHGYPWDAEITLRSFYEGAAKILLICASPSEVREELLEEFWVGQRWAYETH